MWPKLLQLHQSYRGGVYREIRAKKKAQVQTVEPADEPIPAEVTTTENK